MPQRNKFLWWSGLAIAGILLVSTVWLSWPTDSSSQPFDLTRARYVGKSACIECHRAEVEKWTGSHHDMAMELATDKSVLGDFNGSELLHHGIRHRMFRDGQKYMIHTEGPDGQMRDYEVKYVFGVTPLQQYMVEFDVTEKNDSHSLPRVQVLRVCWDTLAKKWFHLDPPDVSEKLDPHDDLHWTGIAQRWNNMCAECHSTDYRKQFDVTTAKYASKFAEIDVSCEACHGPASVHIELARKWLPGWDRERGFGIANLKLSAENQIQACAPCHSRRNVIAPGFQAGNNFYDHYASQLLTESVYYPDGQILDEDYEHGSFIQSKMYHKGIRCSDCHDPHTARLKHDGNQVCTSCHQHPLAKYDSVTHHFHKPDSEGAKCVNCHMPATTYMAVDARRDHSLRIPRPDLSLELDTPNACTSCHLQIENVSAEKRPALKLYQDWMRLAREGDVEIANEIERADRWCNDACEKWYGASRRRDEHFGQALAAGRHRAANAASLLTKLLSKRGPEAPAIARATGLELLSRIDARAAGEQAAEAIVDENPIVRATATSALIGNRNMTQSISLLEKALKDPVRSVRTEAARNLLEYPLNLISGNSTAALREGLNELSLGLLANNDRAGAHLALGIVAEQEGRQRQAIEHYQTAIRVEPTVAGARANLAALLERTRTELTTPIGQDQKNPIEAEINRLRKEELPLLERDAKLAPQIAMVQYRYGLALYVDGQRESALQRIQAAVKLEPNEPQFTQAVAMLHETLGNWNEAVEWARTTVRLTPGDQANQMLLERIESSANSAARPKPAPAVKSN